MGLLARTPALGCLSGRGLGRVSQCPGSWGTAVVQFREPQTLPNHLAQSPKRWSTRPVPGLAQTREKLLEKIHQLPTPGLRPRSQRLLHGGAPECVSLKFPQVNSVHRQITGPLSSGPIAYLVPKRRLQWPCQSPVCNGTLSEMESSFQY